MEKVIIQRQGDSRTATQQMWVALEQHAPPSGVAITEAAHHRLHGGIDNYLAMPARSVSLADAFKLVLDAHWCVQEYRRTRTVILSKRNNTIGVFGAEGATLAAPILRNALAFPSDYVIAGECNGPTFFARDILERDGERLLHLHYETRLRAVLRLIQTGPEEGVRFADTAVDGPSKAALLTQLSREGRAGIILRNLTSKNTAPETAIYAFWSTVFCIVRAVHGRRLTLGFSDQALAAGFVEVPTSSVPCVGSVVEVRYRSADRIVLHQPMFVRPRTDVAQHQCLVAQVRLRQEGDA